jgi:hypothetical protein
MVSNANKPKKLARIWRAAIEVGFITFLFYSNLLMGEFTRSNGRGKTLLVAINDIFTVPDFAIAVLCGLVGHFGIEYFRQQL